MRARQKQTMEVRWRPSGKGNSGSPHSERVDLTINNGLYCCYQGDSLNNPKERICRAEVFINNELVTIVTIVTLRPGKPARTPKWMVTPFAAIIQPPLTLPAETPWTNLVSGPRVAGQFRLRSPRSSRKNTKR